MLAGGAAHAYAAGRKAVFLCPAGISAMLRQVFLGISKGCFFCNRANRACPEHMGSAKHFRTVSMGSGLIFAGEVQVDIRYLITAEAQEGLKGDVKAILFHPTAAVGTLEVRQISAAVITFRHIQDRKLAFRIRAAIMGLEGIHLCDAGHKCHDGRSDRATGANQIAIFQRILHQALGRHIDHIVMAGDNIMKLRFHTLYEHLRRIVAVEPVEFSVYKLL